MKSVLISWSSGKDSTLALYKVLKEKKYTVISLFSTVSAEYNRISMHGVRRELLEKQASSLGLNLRITELPKDITHYTTLC